MLDITSWVCAQMHYGKLTHPPSPPAQISDLNAGTHAALNCGNSLLRTVGHLNLTFLTTDIIGTDEPRTLDLFEVPAQKLLGLVVFASARSR